MGHTTKRLFSLIDKLKDRRLFFVLVFSICVVSFYVRIERIGSAEYIDEQIYVKLARFLANGHLASSSSLLDIYTRHGALLIVPNEAEIVAPWFDHPPFFAILDVPFWLLGVPRLLPILLGALSTYLVIYLLRENRIESLLAGIIFAVYPFAVQLNSMLFLDNGSSFFFLVTLALTSKFDKDKSEVFLILAGVSAGISFLCKETGAFSILFLLLYMILFRKSMERFKVLKAFLISVGIAAVWLVFGLLLNHALFIDIIGAELNLSFLSQDGYQAILNSAVRDFSITTPGFIMGDVSFVLLFSWISLGILLFERGHKLIKIGVSSFLITHIIMNYAWFQTWIGIYPFFSIAIAYVIYRLVHYSSSYMYKFLERSEIP